MMKTIRVELNERVVVFKNGLPLRAYGPGRHVLWGMRLTEARWNTDDLVFSAFPEVRDVLPVEWYREVTLDKRQRGVLYRDGVPRRFLRPGTHRFWVVDPSVQLELFHVDQPMPEMTCELEAVIPSREFVDFTVQHHQKGLRFLQGRLVQVLEPGRYATWTYPEANVRLEVVDMRRQQVVVAGQELMTRDKVTLRLSIAVEYRVDVPEVAHQVTSLYEALYAVVQLAVRDYVSAVTLDQLLEGRDAMTRALEREVVPKSAALGLRVERVGVKDVVMPGEMKTLLNRVIEAEKEAAANVILRREETAATRSLANTARVMSDQPVLLRLKELEAMKEIASNIEEVRVVVGADGLKTLLPAELLAGERKNGHA